ncbi:MAG TPA: DegQ family serine endoprotease [Chthoniobacteraceae bacterium]|nr:DegQ family serine endoprotease [Chthoniobacteraceae bacterium]
MSYPKLGAALLLSALLPISGFSQEKAQAEAPATPQPMPTIKYDPTPLPANTPSYAPVVEKVAPSVVTISTLKLVSGKAPANPGLGKDNPLFNDPTFRRFFGLPDEDGSDTPNPRRRTQPVPPKGGDTGKNEKGSKRQPLGLGSGVIVSPDGYILTNNHVVEGADEIEVTIGLAQHVYKAKKIGTDPSTDIAVIKIEGATGKEFPAVTIADSDKMRAGDIVIAVGNPFGLTQSATMGVVSATGRGGMGIIDYENFIQTDASINMGNSGGALVDFQGRLVGINTAIFSRSGGNQGIGFAVPSNLARSVMESLLKTGKVQRGFLGVGLQPLTDDLVKAFNLKSDEGVLISEVQPKSPAEKAGVQTGDVVVEIDNKPVKSTRELQLTIGAMAPGAKVELKVLREGKEKKVTIDLGERPNKNIAANDKPASSADPDVLDGVTVADIEPETRKEYNIPESVKGVVITAIDPDSLSAAAGLQKGDVVLEIDRERITSAKQAVEASEKLKKKDKVLLRVQSKNATRYVVVEKK